MRQSEKEAVIAMKLSSVLVSILCALVIGCAPSTQPQPSQPGANMTPVLLKRGTPEWCDTSSDGNRLIFAPAESERASIRLISISEKTITPIIYTDPHNTIVSAAISPDGETIALAVEPEWDFRSALWMIDVKARSARKVITPTNESFRGLRYSPDGEHLYYFRTDARLLSNAESPPNRKNLEGPPGYRIYRLDVASGVEEAVLREPIRRAYSLSVDAIGNMYFSASGPMVQIQQRNGDLVWSISMKKEDDWTMRAWGGNFLAAGKTTLSDIQPLAPPSGLTEYRGSIADVSRQGDKLYSGSRSSEEYGGPETLALLWLVPATGDTVRVSSPSHSFSPPCVSTDGAVVVGVAFVKLQQDGTTKHLSTTDTEVFQWAASGAQLAQVTLASLTERETISFGESVR